MMPLSLKRPHEDAHNGNKTKKSRALSFSEALDELDVIANLSGAAARLPRNIKKLENIVDIILKSNERPPSLKKSLKIVLWHIDSDDQSGASETLISNIKKINLEYKNKFKSIVCNILDLSSQKGSIRTLFETKDIVCNEGYPGGCLMFSLRLAAHLDDSFLETVLQNMDPKILKQITNISPDLSYFPLLGERACALLLKFCPNFDIQGFRNLPDRCCNYTLIVNGEELPFNREVLMKFSKYFRAKLSGPWKEKGATVSVIEDIEPNVVKGCLDLIKLDRYTQSPEETWCAHNKEIFDPHGVSEVAGLLDRFNLLKYTSVQDGLNLIVFGLLDQERTKRRIVGSDDSLPILDGLFKVLNYHLPGNIVQKFLSLIKYRTNVLLQNNPEENEVERVNLSELKTRIENQYGLNRPATLDPNRSYAGSFPLEGAPGSFSYAIPFSGTYALEPQ